jgi:hypothetical protein
MDFFIWNIKILIFFKFFRVNPGWPELTRVDPWNPGPGPLAGSTPGPGLITMVETKRRLNRTRRVPVTHLVACRQHQRRIRPRRRNQHHPRPIPATKIPNPAKPSHNSLNAVYKTTNPGNWRCIQRTMIVSHPCRKEARETSKMTLLTLTSKNGNSPPGFELTCSW